MRFSPVMATALLAAALFPSATQADVLARVEADVGSPGPRVARSFLGLSQEFEQTEAAIGGRRGPLNAPFLALVARLGSYGGGAPGLRIGGGSTDSSFLDDAAHERPRGMVHAITAGFLENVARYLRASGSPLVFGINFGLFRPALAADIARAVMTTMPRNSVRGLELGNEPDTYQLFDLYPGRPIRSDPWGPRRYLRQALRYDRAIEAAAPGAPIAGPSIIGGYPAWLRAFPRLVAAQRRHLGMVSIHQYPLLACGSRSGTKRGVSPWDVLAPGALEGRAGLISGLVGYARRQGKSLRITESNSVACGGARGASDSFASALWGADWSFMVAAVRGSGVDFHMASPLYTPLSIGYTASGPAALVRPLYYGMLFFAEATAHRARLLSSSYRKLRTRNRANLNAWATYDRVDRVVRVAIINKDRRARGAVIVHVPHATGPGRLKRLRAPTVRSTRVSFGGQRFSEPSYDGRLLGTPRVPSVRRRPGSRFRVLMDGPGAALLTVPVRRPLR